MNRSIRSHLFINLILSIIFVTFISIAINLAVVHKKFITIIDTTLINKFLLVRTASSYISLPKTQKELIDIEVLRKKISNISPIFKKNNDSLWDQFQLEIWDQNKNILLKTPSLSFEKIFFDYPAGFSDFSIQKKKGRVFIYHDIQTNLNFAISTSYDIINTFEDDLVITTIFALLIASPFVGLFIWLIVNRGLASITQVTNEVKRRLPNNLTPVNTTEIPEEIKPLATELNNLFTKLQEAFSREKRFASDAAHELKTPLAALKIQAQVALNTDDSEELRTSLKNIVKGVDRSTHIVNQLLTLSRALPEASTKKELVSLNKEATTVITEVLYFAKQKNIELELDAPEQGVFIEGNPITLGVLIRNLVDNSIRYTPKGGFVKIVITSTDKEAILTVVDNGRGISDDLREKVFDRFFRVLGTEESGCGLGLSIVKQIAQHHNAEIKLTTPESGIGLEIAVIFKKADSKKTF